MREGCCYAILIMNREHMESSEATNQLLKAKYDLHKSPEVDAAATKTRRLTGEKVPQDPLSRIQNYLDRLDKIINPVPLEGHPKLDRQERNLEMLKTRLYNKVIIKPDEIPESYWENQRRLIRERGQGGDLEQVDWSELKRQNTEAVIADQRSSLDKWVDYFASPDSSWVPDALKYYAIRSVLNMSEYDKEKKMYPQRSKGTTKPFPDLNREALAYVLDAVNKKYQPGYKSDENNPEFEKLLQGENFAKLYAFAIEKVTPASAEDLAATNGRWIKYSQRSNHMPLVQSLQGHGTGWCTAGESTAAVQLQSGDFYVYYSNDKDGKPIVPRAAIRMEEGRIAEVRGIAADQNLDGGVVPIVDEKLKDFGTEGESYKKRVTDMETLTKIEKRVGEGIMLTKPELDFLYEINAPIEGFGYSKDPRIEQLRATQEPYEVMPIMFECTHDQIARNPKQIRPDTKAYVGPLQAGIFDLLSKYNIEHVYTKFPEGRVRQEAVKIGGKTAQQLEAELKQAGVQINRYAQDMLQSQDFATLPTPELLNTVRLTVSDLGFDGTPTTDQIYNRAAELGLDLCPAEVGPHLRLKDKDQPEGEWYYIGMKQIADSHGNQHVFELGRRDGALWLRRPWAPPDRKWGRGPLFVFSLRKSEASISQSLGLLDRIFRR